MVILLKFNVKVHPNTLDGVTTFIWKEGQRPSESVSTLCKICLHFCLFLLAGKSCQVLAGIVAGKSLGHRWHDLSPQIGGLCEGRIEISLSDQEESVQYACHI